MLPSGDVCRYTGFMEQLLCSFQYPLLFGHAVQQFYPHGLNRVSKGQVHPLLIYMGRAQPHTMYPIETPPVNFAADEDTKGRYYYGFLGVFFYLTVRY